MPISNISELLALCVYDPKTKCMNLASGGMSQEYPRVTYSGVTVRANILAYRLAKGDVLSGMFVCHACDNTRCVNPDHLFLGSHVENMRDMVIKGRSRKGESHGRAKLTDSIVKEIRLSGMSNREAAKKYMISPATVGEIMRRKIWKHV